ncbi:MAG: universal stress protein UspA [Verrucomicrobiales bacterium]|nr:universal stress protein UspA [Verrucomicrobiales bacterium]
MATVLSCTEGSQYAPGIYELTAWAASRLQAGVEVLHVVEPFPALTPALDFAGGAGIAITPVYTPETAELDRELIDLANEKSAKILNEARTALQAAGVANPVLTSGDGSLVDVLKHWEKPVEVLVIGKRGDETDTEEGNIGHHLQSLIRSSHWPVLVATRGFHPIQRFLFSFDGGPPSLAVLDFVISSPLLKGLACTLVMAGEPSAENAAALESARQQLQNAGFTVETHLHEGDPEAVSAWEAAAHDIDLLVMGAYSHSRFLQFFTGSTTTEMIRQSRVPILLVNSKKEHS